MPDRMARASQYFALAVLAFAWLLPRHSEAQQAPTGTHYAARPSETGHSGPDPRGGFGASIPLDLPPSGSGLPLPVQIVSSGQRFGAAGVGWDVPLSYVSIDRSFARRRPLPYSGSAAVPRERISVSLLGQLTEVVRSPDGVTWIGRNNPQLVLEADGTGWRLYDGTGATYSFPEDQRLAGTDLYLLRSIDGVGRAKVQLDYAIEDVAVTGSNEPGLAIDLVSVQYNPHPSGACFKHEVALRYSIPLQTTPQVFAVAGDRILVRNDNLLSVDVMSRAGCDATPERLRQYAFAYQIHPATQQQRLASVSMFGQCAPPCPGPQQDVSLPVAVYGYGAVTSGTAVEPVLAYSQNASRSMQRPGASVAGLANTIRLSSTTFSGIGAPYGSQQSFIDMTGDGRPDLVYLDQPTNKLWIARNTLGENATGFAPPAPLNDSTFKRPVLDLRGMAYDRYKGPAESAENHEDVMTQTIDVNGDGRVDIIDAGEKPNFWIVYLNTPDASVASGIKWVRRAYRIDRLYSLFRSRGMAVVNNYLPLSRRSTGRDRGKWFCWRWFPATKSYIPVSLETCPEYDPTIHKPYFGPEKSFVEWEVRDINGDGYPDFVFNSSPVVFTPDKPPTNGGSPPLLLTNEVATVGLAANNRVEGVLNVQGPFILDDANLALATDPFSAQEVLFESTCGVRRWEGADPALTAPYPPSPTTSLVCDISDVNGDGLVDRISGTTVKLGTGFGFSNVRMTLPGFVAKQFSTYPQNCVTPPYNPFYSNEIEGLRDLTGDGIPDYIRRATDSATYWLHAGTGAAFAPPIKIVGPIEISQVDETCDSTPYSRTARGLYDVDGDGIPERVTLSPSGTDFHIHPLVVAGSESIQAAGRIVEIHNGYGGRTKIHYRSAKEDFTTPHRVPFAEIVVDSLDIIADPGTVAKNGLGGSLATTRYAYGNIEQFYDPVADEFRSTGYLRRIELTTTTSPGRLVMATVTDSYPLAPFNPMISSWEWRMGRYLRVGLTKQVTELAGDFSSDPWSLLTLDIDNASGRIASTDYTINLVDTKLFTDGTSPVTGCADMADPYDFKLSSIYNAGQFNYCTARAFIYASATSSWRGSAAPPSANNVQTRTVVQDVDDYARVTRAFYQNDRSLGDDDFCIETTYATGSKRRVLSAVASRKATACNADGEAGYVLAEEAFEYDRLPISAVGDGLVTSHIVYRHATDTGAHIRTVREFDAEYDAQANPYRYVQAREDGASRTMTFEFDPFGLVQVQASVAGTNVPTLSASQAYDEVTGQLRSTTDVNGTIRGTKYDRFGRPRLQTIDTPQDPPGVMAAYSYLGFEGTEPDLGRRVVVKEFADPVAEADVGIGEGTRRTTYFDELGRPRKSHVELGDDYANEQLVIGARTYDELGRVAFEADPYTLTENPRAPYGTTRYFERDGTLGYSIRGPGRQPRTGTPDPSIDLYPTLITHTFANNAETINVWAPDGLSQSSGQYQVYRQEVVTAIGLAVSRSTYQNSTRLEHAELAYDRLGQQQLLTRFQDAAGGTLPVTWSWKLDSLGQVLALSEPASAPQTRTYSDFGELKEVTFTPPLPEPRHTLVTTYDVLGRVIGAEERNGGVTDPATRYSYIYDTPSSSPLVDPTALLGRLSLAKGPTGDVGFSYDAFGRVNARTFFDAGTVYVEQQGFRANGSQAWVQLQLPDNNYVAERVDYAYDSAGRLRSMWSFDGANTQQLFDGVTLDPFGRMRLALFGSETMVQYEAGFAEVGRRLPTGVSITGVDRVGYDKNEWGRAITFEAFDSMGRETSRTERFYDGINGTTRDDKTLSFYDKLGRLQQLIRTRQGAFQARSIFQYDPLGNVLSHNDLVGTADASMSYQTVDRDRICRVGYGGGLAGTTCNVGYDSFGNIVDQPTRTGYNKLEYFNSGAIRNIESSAGPIATFGYDAFGSVGSLEIKNGSTTQRRERRFGPSITVRTQVGPGGTTQHTSRQFAGPGVMLSRRGAKGIWIFQFNEPRGVRLTTNHQGGRVQDLEYMPYGETTSSGAQLGRAEYSYEQWNDGDALEPFGLVHLGARVYDPVTGRFLSRDPLVVPRTAATTNPYAFAFNDPINHSDPTGLDTDLWTGSRQGYNPNNPNAELYRFFGRIGARGSSMMPVLNAAAPVVTASGGILLFVSAPYLGATFGSSLVGLGVPSLLATLTGGGLTGVAAHGGIDLAFQRQSSPREYAVSFGIGGTFSLFGRALEAIRAARDLAAQHADAAIAAYARQTVSQIAGKAGPTAETIAASLARQTAEAAYAAGKLRGAAAGFVPTSGPLIGAYSGQVVPQAEEVTGLLMGVAKAVRRIKLDYFGACGEIKCLEQAYRAGVDPRGGTMFTVNIGESGAGHGMYKAACPICEDVMNFLGIKH